MVIDFHTHNVAERSLAELLLTTQKCGIDRVVLLGDVLRYGFYPTMDEVRRINDDTINDVIENRGICCGFCFLNPCLPADFLLQEMERSFACPGMVGVKLECACNCRRPELTPVMEYLKDHDLPLLHHCWFHSGEKSIPEESDPSDIADLARRYPEVTIIMAHLVGCGIKGIEMVAKLPNVLIDTSGGQPEAGLVEYAVQKIGAERLLFGSDWPYRDCAVQKAKINEAEISSVDKKLILADNARKVLKNVF